MNRTPIAPGQEVSISYGFWTNSHLLMHYGFCIEDNEFESYKFYINLTSPTPSLDDIILDKTNADNI